MADEKRLHRVPPDFMQVPIIWRYELLKYLRSWRLLASVVIVVVILGLLYLLPPALDRPYSGSDVGVELWILSPEDLGGLVPPGPMAPSALGMINRSQIDTETLEIFRNGTPYDAASGANWFLSKITYQGQSVYLLFFMQDIGDDVITANYDWYTSPQTFETLFLGFANILIIICATFFGADALVGEFQNRTGYLIFPNPVKRMTLFFGKYAASITASLLVVGLFYGGVAGLSAYEARGIDDDFGMSFAFAVEFLAATMAIAYLISSVLKGTTGATVLTFFMMIMILPIVDGVSAFTSVKIDASITFAANVIVYILIDPYPTDWSQELPGGFSISNFYPEPATAAIVMAAYTLIAMVLSLLLFKRKQLVG